MLQMVAGCFNMNHFENRLTHRPPTPDHFAAILT
jgi:hypothetical protein